MTRRIYLHTPTTDFKRESSIPADLKDYCWRPARIYLDRDETGWVMEQKVEIFGIGICRDLHHLPAGTQLEVVSEYCLLALNQSSSYLVQTHAGYLVDVGDKYATEHTLFKVAPGVNNTIVESGLGEIFYVTVRPDWIKTLVRAYPELRRLKRWEQVITTTRVHENNLNTNYIRETMKKRILGCQDLQNHRKRYMARCAVNYLVNFINELVESTPQQLTSAEVQLAHDIAETIRENFYLIYIENLLTEKFGRPFQQLDDYFKAVMHNSIHEYLQMERMDWAYHQLANTTEDHESIACLCGYLPWGSPDEELNNDQHSFKRFVRDFKSYYNLTILEVRVEMN